MDSDSVKIDLLSQKILERVLIEVDNNSEDIQIALDIDRNQLKNKLIDIISNKEVINNIFI